MKKTIKRLAAVAVAIFVFVTSFLTLSTSAAVVTDDDMGEIIRIVGDEPGEYGAIKYRYINESGEEVFPEKGLTTQSTESELPAEYNAVEKGYITAPKNQGESGNCWAFSSMSMLESDSIVKGYATPETADFSEAHMVWFTARGRVEDPTDLTYGDGYMEEEPFRMGGGARKAAATLIRWSGIAKESSFPFYPYGLSMMGNYVESERYNRETGLIIESYQEFDTAEETKQWVLEHGSASLAFYYQASFYHSGNYAYCSNVVDSVNHMVTIVGWDDNYPAEKFSANCVPAGNGAWLCKNSWGTYWGDDGYFWVSYYDSSICELSGFSVQKDKYYKNYNYNGAEWQHYYSRTAEARMGNVFTSKGYEKLTAISFDNAYPDVTAKIYVYKNLPENYTKPIQGTQAFYKEMVLDNAGHYTVTLDEELSLEPGEIFSVVVMINNDGDTFWVPAEMGEIFGCTYSGNEGESFFCTNVKYNVWKSSSYYDTFNYFIQAYTNCDHQYTTQTTESTCVEAGSEKILCSQCGTVESERKFALGDHSFSEWKSSFDSEKGVIVREKNCIHCGLSEYEHDRPIKYVRLDELLELIRNRIIDAIRSIFIT